MSTLAQAAFLGGEFRKPSNSASVNPGKLEERTVTPLTSIAAPAPSGSTPTILARKNDPRDPYQEAREGHNKTRDNIQKKFEGLITQPIKSEKEFYSNLTGHKYKCYAKLFAYHVDFLPAKLAEKIHLVVNYKLNLGILPLGTTLSLTLAASARLVTTVALTALALSAAAVVAGAALVIGAATIIASGSVLVFIGGTALGNSPFTVPVVIYKWVTGLQNTIKELKTEVQALKKDRVTLLSPDEVRALIQDRHTLLSLTNHSRVVTIDEEVDTIDDNDDDYYDAASDTGATVSTSNNRPTNRQIEEESDDEESDPTDFTIGKANVVPKQPSGFFANIWRAVTFAG